MTSSSTLGVASRLILVTTALVLLVSCASPTGSTSSNATPSEDEYVYIKETGSHLPKRVKRSELGKSGLPLSSISGEEAAERINHMPIPPPKNN